MATREHEVAAGPFHVLVDPERRLSQQQVLDVLCQHQKTLVCLRDSDECAAGPEDEGTYDGTPSRLLDLKPEADADGAAVEAFEQARALLAEHLSQMKDGFRTVSFESLCDLGDAVIAIYCDFWDHGALPIPPAGPEVPYLWAYGDQARSVVGALCGEIPLVARNWPKVLFDHWSWSLSKTERVMPLGDLRLVLLDEIDRERRKIERLRNRYDGAKRRDQDQASREPIPEDVQILVWRRDGGRCVKCGRNERLEFDHMIPITRGGSNTARNLQLLCEGCNRAKGDRI